MVREHVSTQGMLVREHVSTQDKFAPEYARHVGTGACKHARHVDTLACEHAGHVSTLLARRARNLGDSLEKYANAYAGLCKGQRLRHQNDITWLCSNFIIVYFLRWCRARDLFGSQIPVTTGGFELRITCIRSSYLND